MTLSLLNIKPFNVLHDKKTSPLVPEKPEDKLLMKKIDKRAVLIKEALLSENAFSTFIPNFFDDTFKIRLRSIQILSEIDIDSGYNKYLQKIKAKSKIKKFEKLISNIEVAVESSNSILKEIINKNDSDLNLEEIQKIQSFSFQAYLNILKLSSTLPSEILKDSVDLIESSMVLEIVLIASDIVIGNHPKVEFPQDKIQELEKLILKSALLYGSSAIRLGIMGDKKRKSVISYVNENSPEYKSKLKEKRRKNLDFLTQQAQDLNLGYE